MKVKKAGINKLIKNKIEQKAKWIHRFYPALSVEDMQQEGYELVIRLRQRKGKRVSLAYILKAISYHFSNIIRYTKTRHMSRLPRKDNVGVVRDSEAEDVYVEIDNVMDRAFFLKSLKDKKLYSMLNYLLLGYSPKEIAEMCDTSVRDVYRKLSLIKRIREEWEGI